MKRIIKVLTLLLLGISITIFIFMQQATFGKNPSGSRLVLVKQSANYKEGKFQNLSFTPDLAEGVSYWAVLKEFLFTKHPRLSPTLPLPSVKTDLKNLPTDENLLIWFGHSSYFMQIDGKRILVDPVFSGNASPLSFTTKSFAGTDNYKPDDFPPIDYLFISHDHYDHLDYATIVALQPKVKQVITGIGTGEHLAHWGYTPQQIIEKDWNEKVELTEGFEVHIVPARHFSGRGIIRNQTLWVSFVLKTPTKKIFIGGDSGYDTHFAAIGKQFAPFDLAILECGQYDKSWKYIHLMPEEVVKAAQELGAKQLLPVHWGKFVLGNHPWDEPIKRVTAAAQTAQLPICTPKIGEKMPLTDSLPAFGKWWEGIK